MHSVLGAVIEPGAGHRGFRGQSRSGDLGRSVRSRPPSTGSRFCRGPASTGGCLRWAPPRPGLGAGTAWRPGTPLFLPSPSPPVVLCGGRTAPRCSLRRPTSQPCTSADFISGPEVLFGATAVLRRRRPRRENFCGRPRRQPSAHRARLSAPRPLVLRVSATHRLAKPVRMPATGLEGIRVPTRDVALRDRFGISKRGSRPETISR